MYLVSPLTHSDWMLHSGDSPEWDENGVRRMLERCQKVGFTRILWRTFDAGRAHEKP